MQLTGWDSSTGQNEILERRKFLGECVNPFLEVFDDILRQLCVLKLWFTSKLFRIPWSSYMGSKIKEPALDLLQLLAYHHWNLWLLQAVLSSHSKVSIDLINGAQCLKDLVILGDPFPRVKD